MKILYIRSLFLFNLKAGGSVGHTAGVINSLNKKCNLSVISNDNLWGINFPITVIHPLNLFFLPVEIRELFYSLRLYFRFRKKAGDYQSIYQRHTPGGISGALLSSRSKVPLILEFNSSETWKIKNWQTGGNFFLRLIKSLIKNLLLLPVVSRVEKFNLKTASLVVVVSEPLKDTLIKEAGILPDNILVNPNGIDPGRFRFNELRDIREIYNLSGNFVAGFIGTFGQWHGVLELARSIVLYYSFYPDDGTRFLIIGDGKLMDEFKKIITAGGVAERVIITGLINQEESPAYLVASDVLLSPHIKNPDGTKFFGSPTKLFEYMASGKPIIASNLDQIGEILSHDNTAWLVEPGDIEGLALAIKHLKDNPGLRDKLAKNAKKEVLQKYTWDNHVDNILNKFKHVASSDN